MTQDANAFLMGGGTKSAKFEKVGTVVRGAVIAPAELQQQRDPATGDALYWDADKKQPKLQVKITLATDAKDDADDDGVRALYVKSAMLKAVQEAIKKAGVTGVEVGGKLAVKYTGDGEKKNKAFNAPKLYAAKYEAPDPIQAADEPDEFSAVEPEAVADSLDDF